MSGKLHLICMKTEGSVGDMRPTKFAQIMILG